MNHIFRRPRAQHPAPSTLFPAGNPERHKNQMHVALEIHMGTPLLHMDLGLDMTTQTSYRWGK